MAQHLVSHVQTNDTPGQPVLYLDDPAVDRIFNAFGSATRRTVFLRLCEHPQTISELAAATDRSLQTVQYHLNALAERGLVESVGTATSMKAQQMDVYGPTETPIVVAAPREHGYDPGR
ncbi:MAG: ArsR/SmtB family transcription factor [Salinarchaeum sp.]